MSLKIRKVENMPIHEPTDPKNLASRDPGNENQATPGMKYTEITDMIKMSCYASTSHFFFIHQFLYLMPLNMSTSFFITAHHSPT